jgi:ABC-type phosphate transport system substrate-binding protein
MKSTFLERVTRSGIIFASLTLAMVMAPLTVPAQKDNGSIVVIVNKENQVQSLSLEEIRKLYENDLIQWPNGYKVNLYDLRVNDKTRNKFSGAVLDKEPDRVAREWARKKITNMAKNPPRTVISATLMQERIGSDPAAIGYLPKSQLTSDKVKVVAIIK